MEITEQDTTSDAIAVVPHLQRVPFDQITPIQIATTVARVVAGKGDLAVVADTPFQSAI